MKHGSLFSGIGGFDLAAEWMGWENIFHCEWNEFGQRVLKHYWPNADSLHDITKTDFTKYEGSIDIISGGFPCQPYSAAGKRLGKEDERHLWPEMLRAIREIKPTWVVGENVRGLVNWNGGLVFDEVQSDLEAEGYEVQPFLLPAAAVNAPHRRDRVWFVAYSNECHDRRIARENERESGEERLSERHEIRQSTKSSEIQQNAKNTMCSRFIQRESVEERTEVWQQRNIGAGSSERIYREKGHNATDTSSIGRNSWGDNREERHIQRNINWNASQSESEWNGRKRGIGEIGEIGTTPNTDRSGSPRKEHRQDEPGQHTETHQGFGWSDFPTKPPICGGDDGIPRELDSITFSKWRNESIKAYGNAIVPQVALQIFKAIQEYENLKGGKDNN